VESRSRHCESQQVGLISNMVNPAMRLIWSVLRPSSRSLPCRVTDSEIVECICVKAFSTTAPSPRAVSAAPGEASTARLQFSETCCTARDFLILGAHHFSLTISC
jgi:hypothetical protein